MRNPAYSSADELVRQNIVPLMVDLGYVPAKNIQIVEEKAKKQISTYEEQIRIWKNIAEKRLGELDECQEQLKKERLAKDKELDESINKGIANIAAEVFKKVTASQNSMS